MVTEIAVGAFALARTGDLKALADKRLAITMHNYDSNEKSQQSWDFLQMQVHLLMLFQAYCCFIVSSLFFASSIFDS